ncbi:LPXTG cell wall anchor domain-containing protein [Streptomyces sp. NPDC046161]|uniref:LPXTG cell wall anchor domain-containing protein n=1 Tax=Streptomyces sp. NPDC046161 TaxID=3155132 RepID=UPI0033EC423A
MPAVEKPADEPVAETPQVLPVPPLPDVPVPVTPPVGDKPAGNGEGPFDEDDFHATGPKLGLNGVPSFFKAGGAWTDFTVTVDNSDGKAQESYALVLAVGDEHAKLKSGDVTLQVRFAGTWHDVQIIADEGAVVGLLTDDLNIPKGTLDLQVRIKFNAGAPTGEIFIAAVGGSNVDEDVWSDTVWAQSKITKGSGTGTGTGGNQPKPNGGITPIVDHNNGGSTGTGTGDNTSTGTTDTTNTAGQLAETGTDAATSWALGAGGVALAMGAALVAGTGRRRRTTA